MIGTRGSVLPEPLVCGSICKLLRRFPYSLRPPRLRVSRKSYESTWADENANPHSGQQHVVERWTRPDIGHLHLEMAVTDPKFYTEVIHYQRTWLLGKLGDEVREYSVMLPPPCHGCISATHPAFRRVLRCRLVRTACGRRRRKNRSSKQPREAASRAVLSLRVRIQTARKPPRTK